MHFFIRHKKICSFISLSMIFLICWISAASFYTYAATSVSSLPVDKDVEVEYDSEHVFITYNGSKYTFDRGSLYADLLKTLPVYDSEEQVTEPGYFIVSDSVRYFNGSSYVDFFLLIPAMLILPCSNLFIMVINVIFPYGFLRHPDVFI